MSKIVPTIGDQVIYHLTNEDRKKISPYGNTSDALPAIVVVAWGGYCVNLKVQCDADCPDLWVTSAQKGQSEREWEWPYHYEHRIGD